MDPSEVLCTEVRAALGAGSAEVTDRIQSLWSGYGAILRLKVGGFSQASVVVKSVEPPSLRRHPRGWSSDAGHERKLKSYGVEHYWYEHYAPRCGAGCPVPRVFHLKRREGRWLFVLEDLDAAGFSERRHKLSRAEMGACLNWLATFHATFLGEQPQGLWRPGTYWHLDTRQDEWKVIGDKRLKEAAVALDEKLNAAEFQTLVHGDAKVENFCFRKRGADEQQAGVAAVDFQYVGGGTGVKDVAYFLSSCLGNEECEQQASGWLDVYFAHLRVALAALKPDVKANLVEAEWRALYPLAWADFTRFLLGWAPSHYKLHGYSLRMTELALEQLS